MIKSIPAVLLSGPLVGLLALSCPVAPASDELSAMEAVDKVQGRI